MSRERKKKKRRRKKQKKKEIEIGRKIEKPVVVVVKA